MYIATNDCYFVLYDDLQSDVSGRATLYYEQCRIYSVKGMHNTSGIIYCS